MRLTEQPRTSAGRAPIEGHRIRLSGVVVDFSALIPIYGKSFTVTLLDEFARAHSEGRARYPRPQSDALNLFLQYVAAGATNGANQNCADSYKSLLNGTTLSVDAFEAALEGFIERVRDLSDISIITSTKSSTRFATITHLGSILRDLSPPLKWPTLRYAQPGLGLRPHFGSTSSLGELRVKGEDDRSKGSEKAATVMERNRKRLGAVREVLDGIFEAAWSDFVDGRSRIERADLPDLPTLEAAAAALPPSYGRLTFRPEAHPLVQRCFPSDDLDYRQSALLKLIVLGRGGQTRIGTDSPWQRLINTKRRHV